MVVVPFLKRQKRQVRRGVEPGIRGKYFKSPGLHAGKRLARVLYLHCGPVNVLDIFFGMLPDFVAHWEEENQQEWKGMAWFLERIDHESSEKENKASHMWGIDWINGLAISRRSCTMREFEAIATQVKKEDKPPQQCHLYLIPMAPVLIKPVALTQNLREWPDVVAETAEYFKFGMSSNLRNRHTEYESIRNLNICGLYPARDFYDTRHVGLADVAGLRENYMINQLVKATSGACHGREYFKIGYKEAHAIFGAAIIIDIGLLKK
jgi:hypothetical protein